MIAPDTMLLCRDIAVAEIALAPDVALARARAHEITGPARHVLAALIGAAQPGPILWLGPGWATDRPMGDGLRAFLDPGRLVFGAARDDAGILRATEEALRAGPAPLVIAELSTPPGLTLVRRLLLAAKAGGGAATALLLTPGEGGAAGVETRWHIAPRPGWIRDGRARWRLDRLRARAIPPRSWEMRLEEVRIRLTPLPDRDPKEDPAGGQASPRTGPDRP